MTLDSRFHIGPSFKKQRRKKIAKEDKRFAKLKEIDKLEERTDAIVDPFGRYLDPNKLAYDDSSSEAEYAGEIEAEEAEKQISSIWDREEDIQMGDATDRIAVIGCDWDNINADDIFALFQTIYDSYMAEKNMESAKVVKKASIYLSEFGKSRVPVEDIHGPTLPTSSQSHAEPENDDTNRGDTKEKDEYEAYRIYQLEKSRYYYAIVEITTAEIANILYQELDSVEVGFSINSLDLRFVPDDIKFNDEPVSVSTEIPVGYTPPVSTTSALRHSKVACSWDLTPAKRTKILTGKYNSDELDKLDVNQYLASDDSSGEDEEEVEKEPKGKNYRNLLLNADKNDGNKYDKYGNKTNKSVAGKAGDFYISFDPVAQESEDSDSEPEIEEEELENKSVEGTKDIKDKLEDPRFTKLFSDKNYEIDITSPEYKSSDLYKYILDKRRKNFI